MDTELMSREDWLKILAVMGGHSAPVDEMTDEALTVVVHRRIRTAVVDVATFDSILLRKLPLELRAELVARRLTILSDQTAAIAAAVTRKQFAGAGLAVKVPPELGITHHYGIQNRPVVARLADDGSTVLDLFLEEFVSLVRQKQNGALWESYNGAVMRQIAMAQNG
jgi:hypothetical protein